VFDVKKFGHAHNIYLVPTDNIIVFYWHFNFTKKSDLIGNIAVHPSVRLCLRWSLALTSLATYVAQSISHFPIGLFQDMQVRIYSQPIHICHIKQAVSVACDCITGYTNWRFVLRNFIADCLCPFHVLHRIY